MYYWLLFVTFTATYYDIASGRIAEAFLNYVDSYRVSVGFLYESVNDDRVTSVNGVIDQSCLVLRKVNTAMASCP